MDNIDRLNYLYKQKKTLEFKINIVLTEMGLIKREDNKYEELIKQHNELNKDLYNVEIEIAMIEVVSCVRYLK